VKLANAMPFSPTIPILAALLREIDGIASKASCLQKLDTWYWSSVFTQAYSGAVDTQLTSDFKQVKDWFADDSRVPGSVEEARRIFANLRLRETSAKSSAVYKGILSLVALSGAKDFETKLVLENASTNDQDHIFPRSAYESEPFVNSILNMTWMSKETNRQLKRAHKPASYFEGLLSSKYDNEEELLEVMKSHLVSKAAYQSLRENDFSGFIAKREQTILGNIASRLGVELPATPIAQIVPGAYFANRVAFRNAFRSCRTYIYWIDRYLNKLGLEILAESFDRDAVKTIKLLTSSRKADNSMREDFLRFRKELATLGVSVELHIMSKEVYRVTHDRYIISDSQCLVVPSPDTVSIGQYSEIRPVDVSPPFDDLWKDSLDIVSDWDEIQKTMSEEDGALSS
jgi:hypothetical protein